MTASEYLSSQPVVTRRLFALLLFIVVVAVGWQAVVFPMGQVLLSQNVWREGAVRRLGYSRGIVATESQAKDQLQKLHAAPIWHSLFQDGSAGASDQLKSEVAQALSTVGASALHLTTLPAENEGGLRKYGLRVVATLDAGQLKRFLDALRARAHYFRVEELSVTAPLMQSPNTNPALQLKADIFAYAVTGTADTVPVSTPDQRVPR